MVAKYITAFIGVSCFSLLLLLEMPKVYAEEEKHYVYEEDPVAPVFFVSGHKTQTQKMTAYYPQLFREHETIKAYSFEIYGPMYSPILDGSVSYPPTSLTASLNPVYVHKGFHIFNELVEPYSSTTISVAEAKSSMNALNADNGCLTFTAVNHAGVYRGNAKNGLLWNSTYNFGAIRTTGNIYLQAGFNPVGALGNYNFVDNPTGSGNIFTPTLYAQKMVMSQNASSTHYAIYQDQNGSTAPDGHAALQGYDFFGTSLRLSTYSDSSAMLSFVTEDAVSLWSVKGDTGAVQFGGNMNVAGVIKQNTIPLIPVGSIILFCGSAVPAGWVLCNGVNYTLSSGSILFVPDLRGKFLKGRYPTDSLVSFAGVSAHTHGGAIPERFFPYAHDHPGGYDGTMPEYTTKMYPYSSHTGSGYTGDGSTHPITFVDQWDGGYSYFYGGSYILQVKGSAVKVADDTHKHKITDRRVWVDIPPMSAAATVPSVVISPAMMSGPCGSSETCISPSTASNGTLPPHAKVAYIIKVG